MSKLDELAERVNAYMVDEKREKRREEYAKEKMKKAEIVAASLPRQHEVAAVEAKALYFRYVPLASISRETGINTNTLKELIFGPGGWQEEREEIYKEVRELAKVSAVASFGRIVGVSADLIARSLEGFRTKCKLEERDPTLYEARQVADIFSKVHKAKILEAMDDDDKRKVTLTPSEVLKALGSDPYLKKALELSNAQPEDGEEVDDGDEGPNPELLTDSI